MQILTVKQELTNKQTLILDNNAKNFLLKLHLNFNHIIKNHLDSDLFVITGDLTHFGDEESYCTLNEILTKSDLSNKLYPKLMIGNHDNRENIKKSFSNILIDENGFIQYLIDIEDKRLDLDL